MSRRASESTIVKDSVPALKARVKELEGQLAEHKKRLDDLRKAKNTTILKRQREVLNVNAPTLGRRDSQDNTKLKELEAKIEEMKVTHCKEMEDLNTKHSARPENHSYDHEYEILALRKKITELVGENAAMLFENDGLRDEIGELQSILSAKEASMCQREEELKIKVEKEWQVKYQEWMARTEQKLEDLQEANNMMRTLLKREKPSGRDPTD